MSELVLTIIRDPREDHTPGELFIQGEWFCHTLEDVDRKLESGGRKVYGETCFQPGKYPLVLDFSTRFRKILPHVLGVPQFDGIRLHSGSTTEHTHGCPLVGSTRTGKTLSGGLEVMPVLMSILTEAAAQKIPMFLEVK